MHNVYKGSEYKWILGKLMNIAVHGGLGYVGLVTGACFAEANYNVIMIDLPVVKHKIDSLNQGKCPIYETGLSETIQHTVMQTKKLRATADKKEAVNICSVHFLCAPTPYDENGSCNISYLLSMVTEICDIIKQDGITEKRILVIKSTCPPDTYDAVQGVVNGLNNVVLLVNPETLVEGKAMSSFKQPPCVIIGGQDQEALELLEEMYKAVVQSGTPITLMDPYSAHLAKYYNNVALATQISLCNEIAKLVDVVNSKKKWGMNMMSVRTFVAKDDRNGKFNYPGHGYGGSCFAKDVLALYAFGQKYGVEMSIPISAHNFNQEMKVWLAKKIEKHYGNLQGKKFGLWGLSFKPGTDDVREAPALDVVKYLVSRGAYVAAYDPHAMEQAKMALQKMLTAEEFKRVAFVNSQEECLPHAGDGLYIAVEKPFRNPENIELLRKHKVPAIFDGKNCLSPHLGKIKEAGIIYLGVGVEMK